MIICQGGSKCIGPKGNKACKKIYTNKKVFFIDLADMVLHVMLKPMVMMNVNLVHSVILFQIHVKLIYLFLHSIVQDQQEIVQ